MNTDRTYILSVAHSELQEMTNDTIKITGKYDNNLLPTPIPFYIHLNYLVQWLEGSLQSAQQLIQRSILLEIKGHKQKEIHQ